MKLEYRLTARRSSIGWSALLGCIFALACDGATMDPGSESAAGGSGDEMNASGDRDRSMPSGAGGGQAGGSGGSKGGSRDAAPSGTGGARDGGTGGARDGGTGGTSPVTPLDGSALFFDDFAGASIDAAKWTVFDRIGDQANAEINCCVPANVSLSGGFLLGVSKYEDHTCGDSQQAPVTTHYTSWQIHHTTAPALYDTLELRP